MRGWLVPNKTRDRDAVQEFGEILAERVKSGGQDAHAMGLRTTKLLDRRIAERKPHGELFAGQRALAAIQPVLQPKTDFMFDFDACVWREMTVHDRLHRPTNQGKFP